MKIAIIGYSGSGKSSLARQLGRHYGIPVPHLDQVNFRPGWQEVTNEEMIPQVQTIMDQAGWILWEGRQCKQRDRYQATCSQYADKVLVLKNQKHVDDYLDRLLLFKEVPRKGV
ncbi:GTPase [Eremococcus coleocola]|uniref:GTPase n=1 Tax=Eremococcus coleocola TaxID=88132 RepID=UPI000406DA90|nr:GTPase [Eremococcus coleocola]